MSTSLRIIVMLTVALAVAVAVPATGGATVATNAGAVEKQARTDAGLPPGHAPRARASTPFCVALVALCARVAVSVATGIAGKIAGRGSNAVKSAAKEAAKKQGTSFPKLQKNMKTLAREGRQIRRSKAYRKKLWRKVLRRFRRNAGPATWACLISGTSTLGGGGSIRAAIFACVGAFAGVIGGKKSTHSTSTAQAGQPLRLRPAGHRPRASAPRRYRRALAPG